MNDEKSNINYNYNVREFIKDILKPISVRTMEY